jgi:hypothetical protein
MWNDQQFFDYILLINNINLDYPSASNKILTRGHKLYILVGLLTYLPTYLPT